MLSSARRDGRGRLPERAPERHREVAVARVAEPAGEQREVGVGLEDPLERGAEPQLVAVSRGSLKPVRARKTRARWNGELCTALAISPSERRSPSRSASSSFVASTSSAWPDAVASRVRLPASASRSPLSTASASTRQSASSTSSLSAPELGRAARRSEPLQQVGARLDRAVADREAELPQTGVRQQALVHDEERAVVARRVEQPPPVGLVRVVEHHVVRRRDDRPACVLDDDARAGEDDQVPLVGAVLARPAGVAGPAVELAEDDAIALEHAPDCAVCLHHPVRRRAAAPVGRELGSRHASRRRDDREPGHRRDPDLGRHGGRLRREPPPRRRRHGARPARPARPRPPDVLGAPRRPGGAAGDRARRRRSACSRRAATIDIPRGTPHTFRVVGDEPVRTVVDYAPPGRYEDFIDRLYALAREGKTDEKGAPRNILQTAVVAAAAPGRVRARQAAVRRAEGAVRAARPDRPPRRLPLALGTRPASYPRGARRAAGRRSPGRAHGWPGSMTSCSSFGSDGSQ